MKKIFNYVRDLFYQEKAQIEETFKVFVLILICMAVIMAFFGLAYYLIGILQGTPRSLIDCFYFIWITFATIGYTDEGFAGPLLRLVSIFVGAYLISRFIVFSAHVYSRMVVEEVYNLKVVNQMRRALKRARGHFLIFGDDYELLVKIIEGLINASAVYFVSDNQSLIKDLKQEFKELNYIIEKPAKADTVDLLRPEQAAGAYLLFTEDGSNILLAALLENRVRVICRYSGKLEALPRFKKVGVQPISPHFSGGLKIVSTMIRPVVTEFLDRFVFPPDALLEWRLRRAGTAVEGVFQEVAVCGLADGKPDFNSRPALDQDSLVLGFREPSRAARKLGSLTSSGFPTRTDRFLVLGGGTIGDTVIGEVRATRREIMVIEPHVEKIESLRKLYGEEGVTYLHGDGTAVQYNVEEFDGVAICTPVDESNFAIGLDLVGTGVHRVVRALDDDMEFHYRKIGAIPVFVGRVGAASMLREVTNKFANEVLHRMLVQHWRVDEVYITRACPASDLVENHAVHLVAVVREGGCFFGVEPDEALLVGDIVILCGQVESNKKIRISQRQEI